MDSIKLLLPTGELKEAALQFKNEFYDSGEKTIFGSFKFDNDKYDYSAWLKLVRDNSKEETKDFRWVIMSTFFAVRESDGKIVGIVNLRHYLNDFYKELGHIGYSVLPSERKKGYATEILRQTLEYAKGRGLNEVFVTCKKDNEASRKTIIKNGGVICREFISDGIDYEMFHIVLS